MSNDYDDGAGNARVTLSSPDQGSIYDSPNSPSDVTHHGIIGGLYSGEVASQATRGGEAQKVYIGPNDLGGFTARTDAGSWPVTDAADLQPSDVVTIDGMETRLDVALAAGLLRRDPTTGRIIAASVSEVNQREETKQQQQEQADEQKIAEAKAAMKLDDTTEQLLGTAFAADAGTVMDAMLDVINTGDLSTASVERLADANGATPDQVRVAANHVVKAHADAAISRTAKAAGFDPALVQAALYEAQAQGSTDFNEARRAAFDNGQYGGFLPHVQNWAVSVADTPEGAAAIAKANPGAVRIAADGGLVVRDTVTGYEMSWADAVLSGRFTFRAK